MSHSPVFKRNLVPKVAVLITRAVGGDAHHIPHIGGNESLAQVSKTPCFLKWRCSLPVQSVGMLRNITTFHTLATAAVERTAGAPATGDGQRITYNVIKSRLADLLYKITSQKFEDPAEGEEAIKCAPPPVTCLSVARPKWVHVKP